MNKVKLSSTIALALLTASQSVLAYELVTLTNNADTFYGGKTNPTNHWISGLGGNDSIWGGGGMDIIQGGDGNDTIGGGEIGDNLFGGPGNDTIYGGNGNDHIEGGNGDDALYGGNGDDFIQGGNGCDCIIGGPGNDQYNPTNSCNRISKLPDFNQITASVSSCDAANIHFNYFDGGPGDDVARINGGVNYIVDLEGNNTIYINPNGVTKVKGGQGNDTYIIGAGTITLPEQMLARKLAVPAITISDTGGMNKLQLSGMALGDVRFIRGQNNKISIYDVYKNKTLLNIDGHFNGNIEFTDQILDAKSLLNE